MLPEVFNLLNTSDIRDFVGQSPPRIYKHGTAPQGVAAPYITWSTSGTPEDVLDTPLVDNNSVRVNIWSKNDGSGGREADRLADAVRAAIEAAHHQVTGFSDGHDFETQRYRLSLTFTYWNDH